MENWPEAVKPENFTSIAVYSDLKMTGKFSCSDERINQLARNVLWSLKSNFLDIPTDCPTREHAGWTGDISVFCETACYFTDQRKFLKKWLKDFILEQGEDGSLPIVVPDGGCPDVYCSSCGWSDAIANVPMKLYEFYGDKDFLALVYEAAARFLSFEIKRARGKKILTGTKNSKYRRYVIETGYHYGEWLEPTRPMYKDFIKAIFCPDTEFTTAWFYRMASQCAEIAAELNRMVVANGFRIGTGFHTTYKILPVLCDYGYVETAYKMLQCEDCPSWLFEVKQGATTTFENWNGIAEDGTVQDSQNHYSPGAVAAFLFAYTAGIRPQKPGFEKILIKPVPGGTLTHAEAEYDSVQGKITSAWRIDNGKFMLDITIPVSAQVELPDDLAERNVLSSIKMVGYGIGGALCGIIAPMLISNLGSGKEAYLTVIGIFIVIIVACSVGGTLGFKEHVRIRQGKQYQVKDLFRIITVSPVFITFLTAIIYTTGTSLTTTSNTYYAQYVLGDLGKMTVASMINTLDSGDDTDDLSCPQACR